MDPGPSDRPRAIRLQKYLSDAGVASRRESERLILEGQVSLNGNPVRVLGTRVDPRSDHVTVDGRPVRPRRKLYVALHKPAGILCTRRDPGDRQVVAELLPKEWGHLFTVGRLDRDSEGLIFLTNDGEFSLHLTHPRYGISKRYRAVVAGRVTSPEIATFTQGIRDGGEVLRAERVRVVSANNTRSTVDLELRQGKNHEVRRLFEAIGHPVERLQRVQIGPIPLGELPPGRWRVMSEAEVKSLLRPPARVPDDVPGS